MEMLFHLQKEIYILNSLLEKTIILVGIYNQQFQDYLVLMVFDFQGIDIQDRLRHRTFSVPFTNFRCLFVLPRLFASVFSTSLQSRICFRPEITTNHRT